MPALLFDLVSHERMSFLLSALQCSGEQRAGARARCGVNSMTSCCSDGRPKQMNKGIVVFLLHFVGKAGVVGGVVVLEGSSRHQTVETL